MTDLSIGFAGPDDAAAAEAILREAAQRRLDLCGDRMWSAFDRQAVEAWIGAGELVVGRICGRIVAMALFQDHDPDSWPERPRGEAFYIHKLAVAGDLAGAGLAGRMLDWSLDETRRRGRAFLRLDCVPWPKLCKVYEDSGFRHVDQMAEGGLEPVNRYEKAV